MNLVGCLSGIGDALRCRVNGAKHVYVDKLSFFEWPTEPTASSIKSFSFEYLILKAKCVANRGHLPIRKIGLKLEFSQGRYPLFAERKFGLPVPDIPV